MNPYNITGVNRSIIKKDSVLSSTNNGLKIIEYVFNKLGTDLKIGSKIKNPFYTDKNPSLIINYVNNNYVFYDFGNPLYSGDVFDLLGFYYDKNSKFEFNEILENISNDLNLNIASNQKNENINHLVKFKAFTREEISYFSSYGITDEILDKYNIKSVEWFKVNNKPIYNNDKYIFAYQINFRAWKIYQPNNAKFKFCWVGEKPENYVFGYEQLDYSKDTVIITGGEKDSLSLISLGYNALSLNSETAQLNNEFIIMLKESFENVFICYDNDETGIKQAKIISNKYNLARIDIPFIDIPEYKCKDISDYCYLCKIQNDYTVDYIHESVNYCKQVNIAVKTQSPKPLPLKTYSYLPKILNDILIQYDKLPEREMILLSILAMISGLLPNYFTIYGGKKHFANLYIFIIGKPASGKGKLLDVRQIGESLHNDLSEENIKTEDLTLLNRKLVFIPGNSSHASFIKLFNANEQSGILFETEADVLNENIANEWGDYSVSIRKAFHHEPITVSRSTENEYFELNEPKLTILLSGTNDQFKKYFRSPENGLFSRFIFFILNSESEWRNVFEINSGFNESFEFLNDRMNMINLILKDSNIEFKFTRNQQNKFNDKLSKKNKYFSLIDQQGYLESSIKRLGLIITRLSMILNILEYKDYNELDIISEIICTDKTFEIVMELVEILIEHTYQSYTNLPQTNKTDLVNKLSQPQCLYDSLPDSFTRKHALEIAIKLKIKSEYLDKILKNEFLFKRVARGLYAKVKQNDVSTNNIYTKN